ADIGDHEDALLVLLRPDRGRRDRRCFRNEAALDAIVRRGGADQLGLQVGGWLADLADGLERRQRKVDGEAVARVVTLADLAREQVEQQNLAVALELAFPRRPCDPQPRQAILWKLLRSQCAVKAENDESQQEQQQLRAREALRRIFRVARRRLQELLVERADVMLGRFKA